MNKHELETGHSGYELFPIAKNKRCTTCGIFLPMTKQEVEENPRLPKVDALIPKKE